MDKRKLTFFLTVLGAGVTIMGVSFLLFSWQNRPERYSVIKESPQLPLMEVKEVKFIEWDNQGEKLWDLEADEAVQFPQQIILKNAKLKLFEEGKPVSKGTAKQVIIESPAPNLKLKGDIHIISYKDKAELKTSELRWDSFEKKLYSEEKVTIRKGGLIIKGKGLVGKPDLSSIIIKNQVTTYIEGGNR